MISGENNSFIMLGMNIAADQRDYQMLLNQGQKNNPGTLDSLLTDYQNRKNEINPENKISLINEDEFLEKNEVKLSLVDIENNIFECLLKTKNTDIVDPNNTTLSSLIFNKGLDILESRLNEPFFKELIEKNKDELFNILNERVKDKLGKELFEKNYPALTNYLVKNYSNETKCLQNMTYANVFQKIFNAIKKKFSKSSQLDKNYPVDKSFPIENQLQSLKDRLAINFFNKLVSTEEKPGVISLQEVKSTNNKVIDILTDAGYLIFPPLTEKPDTMIAIDSQKFENVIGEPLNDEEGTVALYAKNKKSGEEFLFVSVHAMGYELVLPKDEDQLNNYIKNTPTNIQNSNKYLVDIKNSITLLTNKYPNAHVIIQGDLNTNPEYFDQAPLNEINEFKNENIFKYFENKNMECIRTEKATELNRFAKDLHDREIDFAFTSEGLKGRVHCINPEDSELSLAQETDTTKEDQTPLHFDPKTLFSDHRPIFYRIDEKEK